MSNPQEKVKIVLVGYQVATPLTKNVIQLSKATSCMKIIQYINKCFNNKEPNIFLYYKNMALYPDTTIQEIVDHTPGLNQIDIQYAFQESFG